MDSVQAGKMEASCGLWSDQAFYMRGYAAEETGAVEAVEPIADGMTLVELDGEEALGTSFTTEVTLGNLSAKEAIAISKAASAEEMVLL